MMSPNRFRRCFSSKSRPPPRNRRRSCGGFVALFLTLFFISSSCLGFIEILCVTPAKFPGDLGFCLLCCEILDRCLAEEFFGFVLAFDCRRRRQNKNKNTNDVVSEAGDSYVGEDETNEKSNHQQEQVGIVYVPEKAELDDGINEEFRKVFERFTFQESAASEEMDKKDEFAQDTDVKKKADSDSDEEEQDNQQEEKGGILNKKKLRRQMKNAELKHICSRPDVLEVGM